MKVTNNAHPTADFLLRRNFGISDVLSPVHQLVDQLGSMPCKIDTPNFKIPPTNSSQVSFDRLSAPLEGPTNLVEGSHSFFGSDQLHNSGSVSADPSQNFNFISNQNSSEFFFTGSNSFYMSNNLPTLTSPVPTVSRLKNSLISKRKACSTMNKFNQNPQHSVLNNSSDNKTYNTNSFKNNSTSNNVSTPELISTCDTNSTTSANCSPQPLSSEGLTQTSQAQCQDHKRKKIKLDFNQLPATPPLQPSSNIHLLSRTTSYMSSETTLDLDNNFEYHSKSSQEKEEEQIEPDFAFLKHPREYSSSSTGTSYSNSTREEEKRESQQPSLSREEDEKSYNMQAKGDSNSSSTQSTSSTSSLTHQQIEKENVKTENQFNGLSCPESLLKEANIIVQSKHGKLISRAVNSADCIISVSCFLQHSWESNLINLRKEEWCTKCKNLFYIEAVKFARQQEGLVVSKIFEPDLKFQCQRGHQWICGWRNYNKKWCSVCKKLIKEEFKQYIKEEEARNNKEYSNRQEQLYEQARRNSIYQSESKTSESDESKNQEYAEKVIQAAQNVDAEVEKLAKEQADKLFSGLDHPREGDDNNSLRPKCDFSHEQAVAVFQMILFPEQVLKIYFSSLSSESLQQQYRTLARNIHPDKNSHPQAAQAFQKLSQFYNECIQSKN